MRKFILSTREMLGYVQTKMGEGQIGIKKIKVPYCVFIFKLAGWDFGYCGHYWPTVPVPGDR
jgi:hypothetical protein